ncbi:MAG: sigma-70 family RNA polymerase sigma factor [Acidobacteria bacterium]|nr:sigma-70 family RNA polymerase sigma factor [Acidobacteriota bacterium]
MAAVSTHEVTQLLLAWRNGDQAAFNQLIPLVEAELRRLARLRLKDERHDHTLQPSALVNETYLRLFGETAIAWQDRAHFFAVASDRMREILIDHARRRLRAKRGGQSVHVSLTAAAELGVEPALEILAVNEALATLERADPRQCRIVVLRYFGGLTEEEIAAVLDISKRTVQREWKSARAWLYSQLKAPSLGAEANVELG